MKPTKSQQKMLDSTAHRLLVSASAGSGKTSTLIEKVASLLKDGVSLSDMLIVTFTESASQEMRSRLSDKLREDSVSQPSLLSQIDDLSSADISTLHSFCAKMLRRYFYMVDLKPSFLVLNEDKSAFLKSKALQKTFKHFSLTKDENFVFLCSCFGGRGDDRLRDAILSLTSFLDSVLDVPSFIEDKFDKAYTTDLSENSACDYLKRYVLHSIKFITKEINSLQIQSCQMEAEYYSQFMANILKALGEVEKSGDFISLRHTISSIILPTFERKKLSNADDNFASDNRERYNLIRRRFSDLQDIVLADVDDGEFANRMSSSKRIASKLIEVQRLFEKYYREEKDKFCGLDFADLERYMISLLSHKEVAENIHKDYIFLDEYQDINSLQEKIISLICNANTKVIMVGDVKQSIYAFRNSSPDIIKEKTRLYSVDNSAGEVVYLNDNFRSNPTILEFVNSIFDNVMDMEFGGVDYSLARLTSPISYEVKSSFPVVEVDYVSLSDEESAYHYDKVYSVLADDNEYEERLTLERAESMVIARRILDLVAGENYIYNPKTEQHKRVEFRDIAILCRGNRFLSLIASVIMEYHVPISSVVSSNVYDSIEVGVLLSLIRLLYSLHDDISLVTVMTSHIGGFSHSDMAKIRLNAEEGSTFYEAVNAHSKHDDDLSIRIRDFLSLISSYRRSLTHCSISDILLHVMDAGYSDYVLSLPGGMDRLKKVNEFVCSLQGKEYDYDISSFLNYVDHYAIDKDVKMNFSSGENCVTLSTIHASKGLEYPIVFIAGCEKDFFANSRHQDVLFDTELSIGLSSVDEESFTQSDNPVKNAISLKKKYREREEELRLLYVALTRAKNHLFILSGGAEEKLGKTANLFDPKNTNSYLPWILSSLSPSLLTTLLNKGNVSRQTPFGRVDYNVFTLENFGISQVDEGRLDHLKCDNRNVDLEQSLSYVMPTSRSIALKNSVSSILQSSEDYLSSHNSAPRRLTIYERGDSDNFASRLGTAYHRVMECVDFAKNFDMDVFASILAEVKIDDDIRECFHYDDIKSCYDAIKSLSPIFCQKELPFISYLRYGDIFDGDGDERVIIQGVADLIVDGGERKYLVDYKTSRIDTPDLLVEKYRVQLRLYKICLEKALNLHFDAVFIYSFHQKSLIKVF